MEECCVCISSAENKKTLSCSHFLCYDCYIRLDKPCCPLCRNDFKYTQQELIERHNLNINYSNWQPPEQLTNINFNVIENTFSVVFDNYITYVPNQRLNKNRFRRRRRALSLDEIKERRRLIKKRCKLKWDKKNGYKNKVRWYEI